MRRVIRERRGMTMLGMLAEHSRPAADSADLPAAVDLRAALMSLPVRKRACVVLRYAFDLSEAETARVLGVSIGTVKSQTSKAVAELERLLGTRPDLRQPAAPGEPPRRREQLTTLPQMPLRGNTARSRRRSGGVGDPAAPSAGENARPPTPIPRIMGMP
ncbi:sigma factor-like helix-turn-helix DNA-binding protein [Frankia sp. EI5c]|uniref:sigma factor-like helix-turn-helix DNA-binding protein n=1 Tax=Frankia sp. EI5c TaxID=683316 RepID=UPI001F5BF6F2|nr:sigma factor-like helix-turn-helix DNA-binding protein [Frankia sp. EI5c]